MSTNWATSRLIADNTKGELSLSHTHTKREKQPWKEQLSSLGYWWNEEFGRISAWCCADKSHVGDQVQNPVAGSKQIEKAQET